MRDWIAGVPGRHAVTAVLLRDTGTCRPPVVPLTEDSLNLMYGHRHTIVLCPVASCACYREIVRYEVELWFAVLAIGVLIFMATTRRGQRWASDLADAIREVRDNFRGGPPRPMHPSPAADSSFVRRRRAKRAHSNS